MMKFPDCVGELKAWAKSGNRWLRRAAAVTLIVPARKGLFLREAFEISDLLLTDSDDLVQKGYGWLLKAETEKHPAEVLAYVLKNKAAMPRTALRYAIEKLPKEQKAEAMKKINTVFNMLMGAFSTNSHLPPYRFSHRYPKVQI